MGWCGGRGSILLGKFLKHLHSLFVELLVALDHEALKGKKAVHGHDLVDNFLVNGVRPGLLASLDELRVTDA